MAVSTAFAVTVSLAVLPLVNRTWDSDGMIKKRSEAANRIAVPCGTGGMIEVGGTGGSGTQPTGYATLSSAFGAINTGVHTGSIVIDVCGDTTEPTVAGTPSAILNRSGLGSSSYSIITLSPVGGARTISGAATAGQPLIDLRGADNVTIDGLNSGGNSLTIANTTVSPTAGTSTIRFIDGATNNTVTNSNLLGSGASAVASNGAVVFFSTDAVTANGNDTNTISNNDIGPAGGNLPTKGILCFGSTATTAIGNSGIAINNNNIFDYFGAATTSAGVAVNGGCNGDSVTNNRFYQTGTRAWTAGTQHYAIFMNSATTISGVQNMTITGNTIGYASNTQTGTYDLTGSTGMFRPIQFNGITGGTVSNINSNTITSIGMTGVTSSGTTTSAPFIGIYVDNGVVTTNTNTIGSDVVTGSISYSSGSVSPSDVCGLFNSSTDAWTASGNNIGGITASNTSTGAANIYGIRVNNSGTGITSSILNNNVGGTVADSLQSTAAAATAGTQVAGIFVSSSIATIAGNTIRNLTAPGGTGTTSVASVVGIAFVSAIPVQTVSQNTIFNLSNTNASTATVVTGIQFTGGTGNIVERNLIHSLTSATSSATAEINGIRVAGGTTTYRNNMIAIGSGTANAPGAVTVTNTSTAAINGILEPAGTDSFFHNSVYVSGTATAGAGASFAFNSTVTSNVRSFRNNIFQNGRTNLGATGKHYAIKINGTAANPAGLTINNNIYFANGSSGAVFGFFKSLDMANLAAWKTNVGQDAGSFESDPKYYDPNNPTPNLHLYPGTATAAEGHGIDVGVVNDFDGETRSGLSPVDIGADAGNLTIGDCHLVFETDFESPVLPTEFSGAGQREGVQGYSGLGVPQNRFGGSFLRNSDNSIPVQTPVTLMLANLPAHTAINLSFLLAIIDSWDGDDYPCCGPDRLNIRVDGNIMPYFSETFDNPQGGTQSYVPPPNVELRRRVGLGFNGFWDDSAYNMERDTARFTNIAHQGSTLTIEWFASGVNWGGLDDESWAIDNVKVSLVNNCVSSTPTNTATNTPSFSPTNTAVNTATPTFTPTNTSTNTATPTNTTTATATSTPTATATSTPAGATIAGTVTYGNAIPAATRFVSNVLISGAGTLPLSVFTGGIGPTEGQYLLLGFGTGAYTVTPTKTGGVNGAISSFDAARIALHVAGPPNPQLTGNQLVVADVSGNGIVSSFDAGQIAKFVAGPPYIAPGIGTTGTWKFVPASRNYSSVTISVAGEDYSALLMGEVSGNWTNTGARPAGSGEQKCGGPTVREGLTLDVECKALTNVRASATFGPSRGIDVELPQLAIPVEKRIVVPVNIQGVADKGVISYEFNLRYDPSVIQPLDDAVDLKDSVSRGLSVVTNAMERGLLRVVVYGALPINENGLLLNLRFAAVGAVGAISPITFERIMFNEGDSRVITTSGQIELF